jgi:hypothetical protein
MKRRRRLQHDRRLLLWLLLLLRVFWGRALSSRNGAPTAAAAAGGGLQLERERGGWPGRGERGYRRGYRAIHALQKARQERDGGGGGDAHVIEITLFQARLRQHLGSWRRRRAHGFVVQSHEQVSSRRRPLWLSQPRVAQRIERVEARDWVPSQAAA